MTKRIESTSRISDATPSTSIQKTIEKEEIKLNEHFVLPPINPHYTNTETQNRYYNNSTDSKLSKLIIIEIWF